MELHVSLSMSVRKWTNKAYGLFYFRLRQLDIAKVVVVVDEAGWDTEANRHRLVMFTAACIMMRKLSFHVKMSRYYTYVWNSWTTYALAVV